MYILLYMTIVRMTLQPTPVYIDGDIKYIYILLYMTSVRMTLRPTPVYIDGYIKYIYILLYITSMRMNISINIDRRGSESHPHNGHI
jgi:hypothetical protein